MAGASGPEQHSSHTQDHAGTDTWQMGTRLGAGKKEAEGTGMSLSL